MSGKHSVKDATDGLPEAYTAASPSACQFSEPGPSCRALQALAHAEEGTQAEEQSNMYRAQK